jgi:hypothetical protein
LVNLKIEDSVPSNDFPSRWGRFPEVASSGVLLKMAFPSTLDTCLHVWTVPVENLRMLCSEPSAVYPFSFPFSGAFLIFLSPYYSTRMWLQGPIDPDLCSLQPAVFKAFYKYLGLILSEINFLDNFPPL